MNTAELELFWLHLKGWKATAAILVLWLLPAVAGYVVGLLSR